MRKETIKILGEVQRRVNGQTQTEFDIEFIRKPLVVKLKKVNENAVIPNYAHNTDAGMDLTAISWEYDEINDNHVYGTGIALEIPEGYVGLIFPRSSNRKTHAYLTNHVGVIDSGYRGEIMLTFKSRDHDKVLNAVALIGDGRFIADEGLHKPYKVGDRIGQLIIVPYPKIEFIEVDSLEESERGEGGHGSTGN